MGLQRLCAAAALALLLNALAASSAAAAPEQTDRAEVRWRLGDRLADRLTRSCVSPRVPAQSSGRYADATYSQNGRAAGAVDAVARTGGATLGQGAFQFSRTRRATRGTRTLRLSNLGVELAGQGGYLVARRSGRVQRIARIARLTLSSGPLIQRGRATPNTFRLTLKGTARALAPLAGLGNARCRGSRARTRIRTGSEIGTVSLSYSPAQAVGAAGTVALRLSVESPRDPTTGQLAAIEVLPLAPADADGETITLPITGSAPLVRGTGDSFVPTGTVSTSAGAVVAVGSTRVELRDLAFSYSQARGLESVAATIGGARHVLATLAADRRFVGDPAATAAIASGLGLSSVSISTLAADAAFTRTGPAG